MRESVQGLECFPDLIIKTLISFDGNFHIGETNAYLLDFMASPLRARDQKAWLSASLLHEPEMKTKSYIFHLRITLFSPLIIWISITA